MIMNSYSFLYKDIISSYKSIEAQKRQLAERFHSTIKEVFGVSEEFGGTIIEYGDSDSCLVVEIRLPCCSINTEDLQVFMQQVGYKKNVNDFVLASKVVDGISSLFIRWKILPIEAATEDETAVILAYNSEKSLAEIMKTFGLSKSGLQEILRKHQVSPRPELVQQESEDKKQMSKVVQMYCREGMSIENIATVFPNLTQEDIQRAIERYESKNCQKEGSKFSPSTIRDNRHKVESSRKGSKVLEWMKKNWYSSDRETRFPSVKDGYFKCSSDLSFSVMTVTKWWKIIEESEY